MLVSPGTYLENLTIRKSIILRSTGGTRATVIDGRQAAAVIDARGAGWGGGMWIAAIDNADRVILTNNIVGQNHASLNGSGLVLLTASEQTLQMTGNVVEGRSEVSLVDCGLLFVIPASNRLINSGGPELSGGCTFP